MKRHDVHTLKIYRHDPENSGSINCNMIRILLEDRRGDLEVGTSGGGSNHHDRNNNFDPLGNATPARCKSDSFCPNCQVYNNVRVLCEGSQGYLWKGFLGGGMDRLDPRKGSFTHFSHDPKNSRSLGHDAVPAVTENHRQNLCVGTNAGGLNFSEAMRQPGIFWLVLNQGPPGRGWLS
jgi:hypothetical protein